MDIRKKQKVVIDALEDVKAKDIEAFDVKHITPEFDRVIIATGDSTRQVKSLARSVHDRMRSLGERVYGLEGEGEGEWVLVDLGDIIVHVMHPAIRAYYNLEELWGQPKVVGKPTPATGPARTSAGRQTAARKSAATETAVASDVAKSKSPRSAKGKSPAVRTSSPEGAAPARAATKRTSSKRAVTGLAPTKRAATKRATAGASARKRTSAADN